MIAIFILEGKLNENDQYQLSKDVEQLAKDWGLSSYLDDVLEDDVCEHNNTITNECSDCNEQELKDKYYNQALRNSLNEISNICCDVLADIVYDECKEFGGLDEQIEEDVKDEILKRLSYKENK